MSDLQQMAIERLNAASEMSLQHYGQLREESVPEVRLCKDAIKAIHESIIPAETLQKIIDAFKEEK